LRVEFFLDATIDNVVLADRVADCDGYIVTGPDSDNQAVIYLHGLFLQFLLPWVTPFAVLSHQS